VDPDQDTSDDGSNSSTDSEEDGIAGLGGQSSRKQGAAVRSGNDGPGSYSMQAAQDMPALPWLTLNHQHAPHFRKMKMDAQTQQSYQRDLQDVSRIQRVQCRVCAMVHEFKLAPGHRAEQRHDII